MERKIGEIFEFESKKLQVKEDKYRTCNDCFFNIICTDESSNIGGYCDEDCRKDGKNVIFTEVIEEQKLNLCEILKYCPKGFKLYSAIHGEVTFFSIEDGMYPICVLTNNNNGIEYFSSDGKLYESCGECLLFPSKEQKDWNKFIAPWYKKEKLVELKESDDEKMRNFIINELVCLRATDEKGSDRYEEFTNAIAWLENRSKEEYALKSFKDEDVRKFMQYIEKQAKAYEFNLPNRSYDIYAFAKDLLVWLENQGTCN